MSEFDGVEPVFDPPAPVIVQRVVDVSAVVVEVIKLEPKPGDLLLFRVPEDTDDDTIATIMDGLRSSLIVPDGARWTVMQGVDCQLVRRAPDHVDPPT